MTVLCSFLLRILEIEGILYHGLAMISSWAKVWLVDFNPVKTDAFLLSLEPVESIPSMIFNDADIKFVESNKHLGVTFTHNGQWHTHIDNTVKSAFKTVVIMRKLEYTFSRQALNQMCIHCSNYLKEHVIFFSIDDSATHPQFESHLLLIDKDIEFPIIFPMF